jgi:hypothetical protein
LPSDSGPVLRLSPADRASRDQLTRALVPQALGRAAAQPGQPVGADVILAQHLDDAPEWRVGVDDEVLKAVGAADHRRLRQHFYTVAADHDAVEPANLTLGKRLGAREGLALGLTLGGVALAARNSANAK